MIKYDVKSVACDYGIFENGELKIIVNSQANALLIKYILEQDLQHKVIADLLRKKNKKHRKFRAMTNAEFCDKHKHCSTCSKCKENISGCCWFMHEYNGIAPYRTSNGKYILIEVKE